MKIKGSPLDVFKNILSILVLMSVFCYLLLNWGNIPNQIPRHYNAVGVIDRWGSKGEVLILPIVALAIYLIITVIEQFPQMWNTGVTVTKENKGRVYGVIKSMLVTEKLIVVAIFCYICVMQSTASALASWFLPLFLIVVSGSISFYIFKVIKIK